MMVNKITVGSLETNCYIIVDKKSNEAVIIDPGDEPNRIALFIEKNGFSPKFILNTHGHFDHIGGDKFLKNRFNIPVLIHRDDAPLIDGTYSMFLSFLKFDIEKVNPDRFIDDGEVIEVGTTKLNIIHTPGHSPGSVCIFSGDYLFSGDTLFNFGHGRTDLFGGSDSQIKNSLKRLFELPSNTIVCPGHGPETRIGIEKERFYGGKY